jgi:hypothetical protein
LIIEKKKYPISNNQYPISKEKIPEGFDYGNRGMTPSTSPLD